MVNKSRVHEITAIGLMAGVMCILGPLSIPIGLIPISFTNLAIYISLYSLGMKKGTMALIIYLLLGLAGLPVFSAFSGGPSKLLGPTGGYLIGFVFMAIVSGFFIDIFYNKWYLCILAMILGLSLCYGFGTSWLSYQANITFRAALAVGVLPFIPGDIFKIIISAYIGPKIRKARNPL